MIKFYFMRTIVLLLAFEHLHDFCLVLSLAAKGMAPLEGYRIKLAYRIF